MTKYNYLIIGSGLFGSVAAHQLGLRGKTCLIIDKRNHVGGNIYTERIDNITVHKYGAHIFHTNNKVIWNYIRSFSEFNNYINSPIANYRGKLYNLPINMNTFYQMWGITSPYDAIKIIETQKTELCINEPRNLEEQAILLVGKDIYNIIIKGYTEKQWGKKASELPSSIIRRLPIRFTFDNNYFNDKYQGIPMGGYTPIIQKMLEKCDIALGSDYFSDKKYFNSQAEKVIYTGEIDRYFDYCYGALEYRSLKFETELLKGISNFQGNAVVNYTDFAIPYTRIIEHKHFEFGSQPNTVITREYPQIFKEGCEPYYPVNDGYNNSLYKRYALLAEQQNNVIFGGRLAEYKYYDMDDIIERAFKLTTQLI